MKNAYKIFVGKPEK